MYSKNEIIKNKIVFRREDMIKEINRWKFKGYKIVFTNGCFDILHRGHAEYLNLAADLGDILIVGLNTDNSVRRLKGDSRPLNDEYARAMVMASMYAVSKVVLFDEDTPFELIKLIMPDILVKGADYKEANIIGADIVKNNGGEIKTIEFVDGYSTTRLIDKIKNE